MKRFILISTIAVLIFLTACDMPIIVEDLTTLEEAAKPTVDLYGEPDEIDSQVLSTGYYVYYNYCEMVDDDNNPLTGVDGKETSFRYHQSVYKFNSSTGWFFCEAFDYVWFPTP